MAKKKINNYFSREIQNNGIEFLNFKNSKDLQLDSVRIFRDISRGKIDIKEYANYLTDTRLVEAALIVANSKYMMHNISAKGIEKLRESMKITDRDVEAVYNYHYQASKAYAIIILGFSGVKQYRNIEPLLPIAGQLSSYSDFI